MAELGPCLACSMMGCRHGQAFVPSSVELWGIKGEATGTPCLLRPCLHHVTPSVTHKGHPPPPSKVTPLQSPLRLASALILAPRSPSHASLGSWSPAPQTQHPEVEGEVSCSLSIRSRPLSPADAQTTWMGPRSERGLREDKAGGRGGGAGPGGAHCLLTEAGPRREQDGQSGVRCSNLGGTKVVTELWWK